MINKLLAIRMNLEAAHEAVSSRRVADALRHIAAAVYFAALVIEHLERIHEADREGRDRGGLE